MNKSLLLMVALYATASLQPEEVPTQRSVVLAAMRARPADPWPRGTGHVLLGTPGALEKAKAYHEPGGSFSPAVGTFGVSLVVTGADGRPITSDQIPLEQIHQQYVWPPGSTIPGIETITPYYRAVWSRTAGGDWHLSVSPAGQRVALLLRSVGPAGGPINQLAWSGQQVRVNRDWSVLFSAPLTVAAVGHEGDPNWLAAHNAAREWDGNDGWGYVKLSATAPGPVQITLHSPAAAPVALRFKATQSVLDLQLPDPRFAASLNDQVANLMMSLVRNETRPGEPVNYPLAWLRDGTYTLTALARAGRIETARAIAPFFAEHDFFGGFGPEADAPGLSLWALEEVALRARDHVFDQMLWPHVTRKAALIYAMHYATAPITREPYGPIVPQHQKKADLSLVCEPARDGLIIGRMDWHRPVLFINAVSYRGLLSAAELADRLQHPEQAAAWRAEAAALRQAWLAAYPHPKWDNDRTYISALWQTGVLGGDTGAFTEKLAARWDKTHDATGDFRRTPLWTYFNVAEAHQWLLLDRPDRVWSTVDWFWSHQASPGLYTWWEGKGEENSFHGWEDVRGWVNPPHVTPHYWTAAEMLLLQMDMLAYLDQRAAPTVVVGAGVKPEWLTQPMRVRGATAGAATIDWAWDQHRMIAAVHGTHVPVRLAPVFPANTPLEIRYDPE